MRADALIQTQLLMAQAIQAIAESVEGSTGYALTPVVFAKLPAAPGRGMISCILDSPVTTGAVTVGGGTNTVLAFYNGTGWKVFAA